MSLKQLISPRKSKKRPYRRRVRNKTHTSINCNEIGSNPVLSINTNIITTASLELNDESKKALKSTHSRTLSYLPLKRPTIKTPKHVCHSPHSPLSPIAIDTTLSSLQLNELIPSPVPYDDDDDVSPYASSYSAAPQNRNYLTFSEATHNFSVSLPSSPVNVKSKDATKNMGFNHEIVNKMQRFSSASNIHVKGTKLKSYDGENVRVLVRFRPINKMEKKYTDSALCSFPHDINISNKNKKMTMHYSKELSSSADCRSYAFRFNRIMDVNSGQKETFDTVAKPICDDILQFKSNHGTIFCYGQSGSGKTYTMFGVGQNTNKKNNKRHRRCTSERIMRKEKENDIESMGIIGRSCCYIFDELKDIKESLYNVYTDFTYNLYMECIEIYNEKLKDLLNSKQTPIIREVETKRHSKIVRNGVIKKGPKIFTTEIQNVTRKHVKSIKEMINILQIVSLNRNMSKTSLNQNSSRSHMIIRFIVKTVNSDNDKRTESIINFVDLAGSENIKKASANKTREKRQKQVKEAGNILKSLTTLSQVIDALIKNKKHVPYKDSKLTRMLQNSLGGNCKTALLICASPHIYNRYETIRSLKFGLRCSQIRNYIKCEYEYVHKHHVHKKRLLQERERERERCHRLSIKHNKPQLTLNDSKSLNLCNKKKKSVELKDNKSVVIKNEDYEDSMKQIEELNIENDLLRTKDSLSQNVASLNENISRIVLQNAFRMNKNKKKKKKNKIVSNNFDMIPRIENALNVFDNELMQITIGLNAKIAKIQDLVEKGLLFCGRSDDDDDDDDDDESEEEEEEEDAEIVVFEEDKDDSADSSNHKIYSESMVQELKQQNGKLQEEIKRLKIEKEHVQALKKTVELKQQNEIAIEGHSDYDEENDTYYICDDEEVYCNVYDTDNNTDMNNDASDKARSTAPGTPKNAVNNLTINVKKTKQEELNEKQTLSEQLNIMEKLRNLDKDNLEYLQMPINLQKYERWAVSPRDSITLLNTQLMNQSNRSSNSSYSAFGNKKTITSNCIFYETPSPSSARSSLNSHTSAISTTIDSIDEHLEKWNGASCSTKPRRSTIGCNNRRRSSANTAISISLSSTTEDTTRTPKTGVASITPHECHEDSMSHSLTYADIQFDDDDDDKQCMLDLKNDPILKEENEEEEEEEGDEEEEEEEESDDDQYSYSTDDDTYYSNHWNDALGDDMNGNTSMQMNKMRRTRTDSQIFRSEGMELSKKFKAKSVESPCLNNQRLSSSFAMHWINLKKKK